MLNIIKKLIIYENFRKILFRNEQKVFSYLKYPKINDTKIDYIKIDDVYINKYFNLTQKEIDILSL